MENRNILETIREGLGLSEDDTSFDVELLIHINAAVARLTQNGVGKYVDINTETMWYDILVDPTAEQEYSNMIPKYVLISTKLIFDPPAPSIVDQYVRMAEEMLWCLKISYEKPVEVKKVEE